MARVWSPPRMASDALSYDLVQCLVDACVTANVQPPRSVRRVHAGRLTSRCCTTGPSLGAVRGGERGGEARRRLAKEVKSLLWRRKSHDEEREARRRAERALFGECGHGVDCARGSAGRVWQAHALSLYRCDPPARAARRRATSTRERGAARAARPGSRWFRPPRNNGLHDVERRPRRAAARSSADACPRLSELELLDDARADSRAADALRPHERRPRRARWTAAVLGGCSAAATLFWGRCRDAARSSGAQRGQGARRRPALALRRSRADGRSRSSRSDRRRATSTRCASSCTACAACGPPARTSAPEA